MNTLRYPWIIAGASMLLIFSIWLFGTILQPHVWVRENQIDENRLTRNEIIYRGDRVTYHQTEQSTHAFSHWHHLEITSELGDNCYDVSYIATTEGKRFVLCTKDETLTFSSNEYHRASKFEALRAVIKSLLPINYSR